MSRVICYKNCILLDIILVACLIYLFIDTEMESCETERSVLKRKLATSAVEIERQVTRNPNVWDHLYM